MPIEITPGKNRQGKKVYRIRVRVRKPDFQRSKTKTFNDKKLGLSWGNRTEEALLDEYELIQSGRPVKPKNSNMTLADYLQSVLDYMELLPEQDRFRKSDLSCLRKWQRTPLGRIKSADLGDHELFTYFESRIRKENISPATNHSDLCVLTKAIKWQKRIGITFNSFITDELKKELWELKLTGKSRHKEVRPTEEQVFTLYDQFLIRDHHPAAKIKYRYMLLFAIYSTFRLKEICKLKWSNYNPDTGEIIIEHRKDPNNKWGNHEKIPLHQECVKLINMQPRTYDRIFPFNSASISSKFNKVTEALGMPDVTFHCLRHEGVSRLFEKGYSIPQVAVHSGHKNWNNLRRYTHLLQKTPPDLFSACMKLEKAYFARIADQCKVEE